MKTKPPRPPVKRPPRVAITSVAPLVQGGRHPAKRVLGDVVTVTCTVVADGAHVLAARVVHDEPSGASHAVDMRRVEGPNFTADIEPTELGEHTFRVEAWIDEAATIRSKIERKRAAGQDVANEERELELLESPVADQVASGPHRIQVSRPLAACSAWYEFFPRSTVVGPGEAADAPRRHGTLKEAVDRLDRIAAMGFDIVYLPPIHPIGTSFRKGPDNALEAGPDDVGSPWAIGAPEGGHDAVHPLLGTHDDVRQLVDAARERGLEIALDLAFQCSPDHPWIREHPEWFRIRPDGTIAYAENPPKRYQDIVPLDFESAAWRSLWQALADVVDHWRAHGVRVFRVDNPHTKSFPFWQWLISSVHKEDPGVIFLAEAFSHPEVMLQLSRLGFSQSYTHFPWQHTPDILTAELQQKLRQVFVTRLVLAATLSASYGIYGPVYELLEGDARNGAEEYAHNEKYELRTWDLDDPASIEPVIRRVNEVRRGHAALQHDRSITFHRSDNPRLVAFSKTAPRRSATLDPAPGASREPILVVANTDHWNAQEGMVHLDLERLGLSGVDAYDVHDLLSGATYRWHGPVNYVRLDPWSEHPVHLFAVRTLDRVVAA